MTISPEMLQAWSTTIQPDVKMTTMTTTSRSHLFADNIPSLSSSSSSSQTEVTPLLLSVPSGPGPTMFSSPWQDQYHGHNSENHDDTTTTPKTGIRGRKQYENGKRQPHHVRLPSLTTTTTGMMLPAIDESISPVSITTPTGSTPSHHDNRSSWMKKPSWAGTTFGGERIWIKEIMNPTTIIGSFMYLMYHVVFCLALGSAILRPHSTTNLLGLMTKTAALGTISSSMIYFWRLSSEIPALYPSVVSTCRVYPTCVMSCVVCRSFEYMYLVFYTSN